MNGSVNRLGPRASPPRCHSFDELERPGVRFLDEPAAPVPVTTPTREVIAPPGTPFTTPLGHYYIATAEIDSETAAEELVAQEPEVEGVYADPEIAPCPTVCPGAAVGAVPDVENQINIGPVHTAGHRGQGVRVAVVDTGIDGTRINVSGGLNMPGFPAPGTSPADHGTMVAFDALIGAPNAMIFDYPLLKSVAGGGWIGFLSDAIRIYAELMVQVLQTPGPLVVVNSWAMYSPQPGPPSRSPAKLQRQSAPPVQPDPR